MARVLLMVPARGPLRESAARLESSSREGGLESTGDAPPRIEASAEEIGLDARIRIDPDFAAVPMGGGEPEAATESFRPDASDRFVIRAEVPDELAEAERIGEAAVFKDPDIAPFATVCGDDPAVGGRADVRALHRIDPVHARGLRGGRVAVAIMDTGISASHLASKGMAGTVDTSVVWNALSAIAAGGRIVPAGGHRTDHGTMCAYDALIAAPDARLLDYPILHSARTPSGSAMGGALSDALQAYAHLEAFWLVTGTPARARYDSLVINNSWGLYHPSWDFPAGHPGRYIDNIRHPFNIKVAAMARAGVDVVFAAGNCGSQCPSSRCRGNVTHSIMGASAHPDVLTLAGISTRGDRIGYSSEGPPLPGLGTTQKPDLAAATHFRGSDAFGDGVPDNGTSASCPVAAGCIAALRTSLPQRSFPPHHLRQALIRTARQPAGVPAGWNGRTGHGVIDLDAAARHLGI